MENKYLEKLARFEAFKNTAKKLIVDNPRTASGLTGGAIGAAFGAGNAIENNHEAKKLYEEGRISKATYDKRHINPWASAATTGAVVGGLGAFMTHQNIKAQKAFSEKYKSYDGAFKWDHSRENWRNGRAGSGSGSRYNGFHSATDDLEEIYKDLGAKRGQFKTKREAINHYRKAAGKLHPDRGGSLEDMQKLNAAWQKFKKHGGGFDKLAMLLPGNLYMEKIASALKTIGVGAALGAGLGGYTGMLLPSVNAIGQEVSKEGGPKNLFKNSDPRYTKQILRGGLLGVLSGAAAGAATGAGIALSRR